MCAGVDAGVGDEERPNPCEDSPRAVEEGDEDGEGGVVADVAGGEGAAFFPRGGSADFDAV